MDLTGLRKCLKSEHIFHQDFWNPRGEEGMKTWQSSLKWQVFHFSCSTLEIRYLILTEVIIFITPIKEANTCHLPDFWEGFNFSPLQRWLYFPGWGQMPLLYRVTSILSSQETVPGSLFCAEGGINSHCWTRSKGSSLWTQQGQAFCLGRMGGSCPAACSSRRWPSLLQPACWRWWRSGCSALRHGDLPSP